MRRGIIDAQPQARQLPFTVDTHLLRELGALLVGRDSTALLELIKNAYDADATKVTVHAAGLATGAGILSVTDDGHGMTFEGFQSGFLRIAGRTKETSSRKSVLFDRRFTGAKGIGRLAAHKLASNLVVTSVPDAVVLGRIYRERAKDFARYDGFTDTDRRKVAAKAALQRAGEDDYSGVEAVLDWDAMEGEHEDLSQLGDSLLATPLETGTTADTGSGAGMSGTSMSLEGTREVWTPRRRATFINEIRSCRPPAVLTEALTEKVVSEPLVFTNAKFAESGKDDPGFELELTGELSEGENLWQTLAERSDWVLEIESSRKQIKYSIAPTRRSLQSFSSTPGDGNSEPWAETRSFFRPQPHPLEGPFFQARVLVTEGSVGRRGSGTGLAAFERQQSGVRVFFEGFRVLPYGADRDDWLGLDRDYVAKQRVFDTPEDLDSESVKNEGFVQLGNRAYYGAVFLTEGGAPHLQPLVNREGFVPDEYFGRLTNIVRTGVDLVTRTRAATSRRVKAAARAAKEAELHAEIAYRDTSHPTPPASSDAPEHAGWGTPTPTSPTDDAVASGTDPLTHAANPAEGMSGSPGRLLGSTETGVSAPAAQPPPGMRGVNELIASAIAAAAALRVAVSAGNAGNVFSPTASPDAADPVDTSPLAVQFAFGVRQLEGILELLASYAATATEDQNTLRTVASVGTQFSAFIHELNGLLAQAETVRGLVGSLLDDQDLTRAQRRSIRDIQDASGDLVASLNRQASYLTDVVGPEARRRRTRMVVRDRAESSARLVLPRVLDRDQQLDIDIDASVKSPPMFPAEIAIIFTNLLTNATKFAGKQGRIKVSGVIDAETQMVLRVENTGVEVASADRDRFFRPFESSTTDVDVVLGQGMGLGLTIVRNVADDYNGFAYFAEPSDGFATAVEVVIPDPRPDIARKGVRGAR
ncbi:MAG: sensor histidine kinase [Ornithinimicrobium sp.]